MKNLKWKALIVTALMLVACQGGSPSPTDPLFKPENSFGADAPIDAQVITPEEFKALSTDEGFTIDTLKLRASRKAAADAQFKTDDASIKALAAQNPAYSKALTEPDLTDPDLKILPDGSYLQTVTGNDGKKFQVVTDGKASLYSDILEGKKSFENPANQLRVYTSSYNELPEALKASLPTPASLAGASLAAILTARSDLGKLLAANPGTISDAQSVSKNPQTRTVPPNAKPVNYPASPSLEEGAGKGIDRTGTCTPQATGLYQNFWWRQKFYATSVKDQGSRGSCVAFALTAALETRTAIEQSRYVNLSEQFLWGKIASEWDAREYGDGTPMPARAEDFHDQNYALPFETVWNYNTAMARIDHNDKDHNDGDYYSHSCDGYTEFCSEASHQLKRVCTHPSGGDWVCAYHMPAASGPRFKESLPDTIYAWNSSSLPVEEMRLKLRQGHPMIAGLIVNYGWDNPSVGGYITTLSDSAVRGGHAVQIVGFISASDIFANPALPLAIKAQSIALGGGYFIIKNSWGCNFGDAGYIYVPVAWAIQNFTRVTVFESTPSATFKSTPNQAPTISITAPKDGSSFGYASDTTYTASVVDPDSAAPKVTWTSDVDGLLGTGLSITKAFDAPGKRIITATATDDQGATASASITVTGNNLAPTVTINTPLASDVIWAGVTQVDLVGSSSDTNGAAFGELPCANLVWKSSNLSDTLGSGCSLSVTFATTGQRTITLTGTDTYGATGKATVTVNVTTKPLSGPPMVKITSPVSGSTHANPSTNIALYFSNNDPGGDGTSVYKVVWTIVNPNNTQTVITPKACPGKFTTYPCFAPSDYGYGSSPASNITLKLTVTDPENLTGTDTVTITVGVPG